MAQLLAEEVIRKIEESAGLYYRLTLLVAPSGGGKTSVLQDAKERIGVPLINLNLELSRRMLDLTARQRALQIPKLSEEIVIQAGNSVILLDNTEILFDISLKQDPLRLFQGISRNRTVVAAWNGSVENNYILYAEPGHPEYRRYPIRDLLLVCPARTIA
ncbi:BREX-3 system P-loop-containing protein BrxF [Candidatus Manganitrophus noduliformans]|uniref:BREX-3 system P-loop-containing protein BrxF n=1 Tax=Candidatus Manganitrophus noduliformans TaxID=2606439 RepID=A0A7X6ICS4_9BACT|nr:BREX-3 system P-loop-containing protein BrxF [Candidatus Manganitrophus noduliformans]NKE72820.1 BREX-3 system P-loop-containing protein BrxF [Candidatus Manganitrophus noduliformans]